MLFLIKYESAENCFTYISQSSKKDLLTKIRRKYEEDTISNKKFLL